MIAWWEEGWDKRCGSDEEDEKDRKISSQISYGDNVANFICVIFLVILALIILCVILLQ